MVLKIVDLKEFSFDEDDYEEFALIIEEEEDEDDPFVEQVTMGRRSGHLSGVGSSLTFIITHPALQYDTPQDPLYWEF